MCAGPFTGISSIRIYCPIQLIFYSAISFIQQVFRHADIFLLLVAVNLALDGDVTFVTDLF